jgi:hypothetical protein
MGIGTKFYTKQGWLTPYAIACGYIEIANTSTQGSTHGTTIRLWHEGGPAIHVRVHDHDKNERIAWETFETLTEARKYFRKMCRELSATRQKPKGY